MIAMLGEIQKALMCGVWNRTIVARTSEWMWARKETDSHRYIYCLKQYIYIYRYINLFIHTHIDNPRYTFGLVCLSVHQNLMGHLITKFSFLGSFDILFSNNVL